MPCAQRTDHVLGLRAVQDEAVDRGRLLPVPLVALQHDLPAGRVDRLDRERPTGGGEAVRERAAPAAGRVLEQMGGQQIVEQGLPPGVGIVEDDLDTFTAVARTDVRDQPVPGGVDHTRLMLHRLGEVDEVLHRDRGTVGPRRLRPDPVGDRERVLSRDLRGGHQVRVELPVTVLVRAEHRRQQQFGQRRGHGGHVGQLMRVVPADHPVESHHDPRVGAGFRSGGLRHRAAHHRRWRGVRARGEHDGQPGRERGPPTSGPHTLRSHVVAPPCSSTSVAAHRAVPCGPCPSGHSAPRRPGDPAHGIVEPGPQPGSTHGPSGGGPSVSGAREPPVRRSGRGSSRGSVPWPAG